MLPNQFQISILSHFSVFDVSNDLSCIWYRTSFRFQYLAQLVCLISRALIWEHFLAGYYFSSNRMSCSRDHHTLLNDLILTGHQFLTSYSMVVVSTTAACGGEYVPHVTDHLGSVRHQLIPFFVNTDESLSPGVLLD